ncbi:MAG: hypothetical protein NZ922_05120 [Candidatus Methanomethyliaceae archaeon]|nr:hypothetical protein [Candidatus Methanomethyliaceae archaeon]MDW7970583.1 hypothetical protein [Nitrososphaerota archaeon]
MPEKSFRIKISNIKGDVAVFNPSDLSDIGAPEDAEVELYTTARGWKVKATTDCKLERGVLLVNQKVAAKLEVGEGGEVRASWSPPVVEEKYEPPP